jgi:hypothetical protein
MLEIATGFCDNPRAVAELNLNPFDPMSQRYLEVTYRQGKVLAAYLDLPRSPEDRSARVGAQGPGYLVDWTEEGRPIGMEMPSPSLVTLEGLNRVLAELHLEPAAPSEVAPLSAA